MASKEAFAAAIQEGVDQLKDGEVSTWLLRGGRRYRVALFSGVLVTSKENERSFVAVVAPAENIEGATKVYAVPSEQVLSTGHNPEKIFLWPNEAQPHLKIAFNHSRKTGEIPTLTEVEWDEAGVQATSTTHTLTNFLPLDILPPNVPDPLGHE